MAVGEWDERQLCSDGACIGVIGPDGTCNVCGRVAESWGDERNRGLAPVADAPPPDRQPLDDTPAPSPPAAPGEPAPWQERTLCPDGGCVGVIGDDGRCKVCGKEAAWSPA